MYKSAWTITSEDVISATHLSTFLLCSICVTITAQILAVDSSATGILSRDKKKKGNFYLI
jgi:hypothetical protein